MFGEGAETDCHT